MNNLRRWLIRSLWTLGVASLLLGLLITDFLRFGGVFTSLPAVQADGCQPIALTASAEDIQIDRGRELAYLSLLDRRALVDGRGRDGDIGVIDLNQPFAGSVSALTIIPDGFRPHGMSLYRMDDGGHRLFVISHPADASHVIEVFEQAPEGGNFLHIASYKHPLFHSPNAIVATGADQFYIVNDSGAETGLDRVRETLFRSGLSTLVYFDGNAARVVANGLKSGVGLGISPDGQSVYVAETLGKRLAVFERNVVTGEVSLLRHVPTPGSPDNIHIDTGGALWIAVHPKLLDLIRHFGNENHPAPTVILHHIDRWQSAHVNHGELLSAGSVGTLHDGMLLIGSITEPKLLHCPFKEGGT